MNSYTNITNVKTENGVIDSFTLNNKVEVRIFTTNTTVRYHVSGDKKESLEYVDKIMSEFSKEGYGYDSKVKIYNEGKKFVVIRKAFETWNNPPF